MVVQILVHQLFVYDYFLYWLAFRVSSFMKNLFASVLGEFLFQSQCSSNPLLPSCCGLFGARMKTEEKANGISVLNKQNLFKIRVSIQQVEVSV